MRRLFLFLVVILIANNLFSQGEDDFIRVVDYRNPGEYIIEDITVEGVKYLDKNALINLSGLVIGSKITIPGEDITNAIKKFWDHGLFADVKIYVTKTEGNKAYLEIYLLERPRLSKFNITGIKKSEKEDLEEKLNLRRGSQVTDHVLSNIEIIIKDHFTEKGFYNTDVVITQNLDTTYKNQVELDIEVKKNEKVKIKEIVFLGNENFPDKKLRKTMKKTKQRDWNIFKSSKLVAEEYKNDKAALQTFYNDKGYRDMVLLYDSIKLINEKRVVLTISLYEGTKYYVRDINWIGNTKYPTEILSAVLGIKKGDVYNQTLFEKRLFTDEDAVNSLYLDYGYLFSSITPVEVVVENDSIDFEMRIIEGDPATINNVIITGNTRTNEHVVRREIRTVPGELFSKSDIIRTVRELAQLGHFDPEKIEPVPIPDPDNSTVDLQYKLEEKHNDQLEVSGGWGAGMFVGTVGLRFSNFAARNLFKPKEWGGPVPTGDGQTLSIRAQANGRFYQSYNITFVEPWLGGKKPNSLSVSIFRNRTRLPKSGSSYYFGEPGEGYFKMMGASVGFGKRLRWPDDYFSIYNEISYTLYDLHEYTGRFLFDNGKANNLSFLAALSRSSSGPNPIYPMQGSDFSLSLEFTPPYSKLNHKDYSTIADTAKYNWIEFHKWKFKADWYLTLVDKLVLCARANFGYMGYYNKDIGPSPFGSFDVGGDGMAGFFNYYGYEIVALRGYENSTLTPIINGFKSGNIYNKYTIELRYPLLMNPQSTFYLETFLEGGNAWYDMDTFNPFIIKRSAGIGLRAFLPMFGLLGIDWGYGFDAPWGSVTKHGSQFHFTIGQQF
ncbi:MAG: outer membrane protein assembly factor BamA [Bacteroidales bacterium]|nr:outer membrane protein assembly factor BamA [Bacteroidales bacterium]